MNFVKKTRIPVQLEKMSFLLSEVSVHLFGKEFHWGEDSLHFSQNFRKIRNVIILNTPFHILSLVSTTIRMSFAALFLHDVTWNYTSWKYLKIWYLKARVPEYMMHDETSTCQETGFQIRIDMAVEEKVVQRFLLICSH